MEALVDRPSRRAHPKAVHLCGVDLRRTRQTYEVSIDTSWAVARYDAGEPVLADGVERLIRGGFTYRVPGRPWRNDDSAVVRTKRPVSPACPAAEAKLVATTRTGRHREAS